MKSRYEPSHSLKLRHWLLSLAAATTFCCQSNAQYEAVPGSLPIITNNVVGGYIDSEFAAMQFTQSLSEKQSQKLGEQRKQRQKLLDSGMVSALDLEAPAKAMSEFNKGQELLQKHKSGEAAKYLERAVARYPKFVSAHNNLGVAYQDMDENARAKSELETAVGLDSKFAAAYVNLGKFELARKNFDAAESDLQKAVALRPTDANVLTVLVYAENSNRQYHHVIETAVQVHSLPHKGLADVHYLAASAAIALKDYNTVGRELELFLKEDPSNPLAPVVRHNLKVLASYTAPPASLDSNGAPSRITTTIVPKIDTANSDALKNALASLDTPDEECTDCQLVHEAALRPPGSGDAQQKPALIGTSAGAWKIRDVVNEVAVFFAVTSRATPVNNLDARDLTIRDDDKPPTRILQFAPQSKLPLHLGLLVDISGSLNPRFSFEKKAASTFVDTILRNSSDLAFVAGFANNVKVSQDFTADTRELSSGIESLTTNGGTAIWDALTFACWKLAAYPENQRVARVLVVLTDGEDNASHTSLKRAIQIAESTGVTVYAIGTREYQDMQKFGVSDADKTLQALAERTGGEAMFPGEISSLNKTFAKLHEVIRNRYLVAYRPADFRNDGHYRKISIVATKDGKRIKVHAREGYYTPREAAN